MSMAIRTFSKQELNHCNWRIAFKSDGSIVPSLRMSGTVQSKYLPYLTSPETKPNETLPSKWLLNVYRNEWTVKNIVTPPKLYCCNQPSCISPIRTTCGQCCSVLTKKGFVTPSITFGLRRKIKYNAISKQICWKQELMWNFIYFFNKSNSK